METYDIVNDQWNPDSQLKTARKDHACSHLTLDDESGILVTGGVDDNNQPLKSVEFYSFRLREWIELGPMKIARTEHGLAIINGIPTVIGGISTTEFLANVEQLDASKDRDAPYAREWQIVPMVWIMVYVTFNNNKYIYNIITSIFLTFLFLFLGFVSSALRFCSVSNSIKNDP